VAILQDDLIPFAQHVTSYRGEREIVVAIAEREGLPHRRIIAVNVDSVKGLGVVGSACDLEVELALNEARTHIGRHRRHNLHHDLPMLIDCPFGREHVAGIHGSPPGCLTAAQYSGDAGHKRERSHVYRVCTFSSPDVTRSVSTNLLPRL